MDAGRHKAQAVGIEWGVSDNGNDYAAISFSHSVTGEIITKWLYFSERAAKYSIEVLRKLGWKGNDIDKVTVADLCNEVEITVVEDEYDGKRRMKVEYVNAIGEGPKVVKNAMTGVQKQSFAERMRGIAMSVPAVAGTPAASKAQKAPTSKPTPAMTDDDIPF